MSDAHDHDSPEAIKKSLKTYWIIFGALLVLTGSTVAAAELHFLTFHQAIALAMVIAVVKGTLVALFFMHLISEKKAIYATMALTVVFFFTCLFIPLLTDHETQGRSIRQASAESHVP